MNAPRPAGERTRADDPEGQGMAFRAFGAEITEIGLRQIGRPLTNADVESAALFARAVLAWCGEAGDVTGAERIDIERLARAIQADIARRRPLESGQPLTAWSEVMRTAIFIVAAYERDGLAL